MCLQKIVLSIVFLVTAFTLKAQNPASNSGIDVQGIVRDANNTVKGSQTVSLTFELYYIDALSNDKRTSVYSVTESLTTDPFGVFSYTLNPGSAYDAIYEYSDMYLKVSENGITISDASLTEGGYAIAASNGAPTGTIAAYTSSTIPSGWVLCNGQSLTNISGSAKLISMIGSHAPNLQGMFLRGTGTSPVNNQNGPNLRSTQTDAYKAHNHGSGTLGTGDAGNHHHGNGSFNHFLRNTGTHTSKSTDGNDAGGKEPNLLSKGDENSAGNHHHTISGYTAYSGGTETRPVNYGVYFIIKL